jgi:hypothetical protein
MVNLIGENYNINNQDLEINQKDQKDQKDQKVGTKDQKNKEIDKKKFVLDKNQFIKYNIFFLSFLIIIIITSYILPNNLFKITITNKIILNHILPLLYFALFSLLTGFIVSYGFKYDMSYLLDIIDNITIGRALIPAYLATISLIISGYIKLIIEKLLNTKIIYSRIHDIFGFTLGRVILLFIIYIFNL